MDKLTLYVLGSSVCVVLIMAIASWIGWYRGKRAVARRQSPSPSVAGEEPAKPSGHLYLRVSLSVYRTDSMAKEKTVYIESSLPTWRVLMQPDVTWLSAERIGSADLRLRLSTNFDTAAREATVRISLPALDGDSPIEATLTVIQSETGYYPELAVSDTFYIQSGEASGMVCPEILPPAKCDEWRVKSVYTNDEGGWCETTPPPGKPIYGPSALIVRSLPKPAHISVRNAIVTVECGTYPFNTLRTVVVSQGIIFTYYIEYPAFDPCSRGHDVIETPLTYREGDPLRHYTVYVRCNLRWKLLYAPADWFCVGPVEEEAELHNGRFRITVCPNDERTRHDGFCAARKTVISMVTEMGQVRDILIYQGGYVVIRGRRWLDRNLLSAGRLTVSAVPLDLPGGHGDIRGGFFQFGCPSADWQEELPSVGRVWNLNTNEHPVRDPETDPSPAGWRVPSSLELDGLFSYRNYAAGYTSGSWHSILSDQAVPVFFPLGGYRSHINGSVMEAGIEGRYWCGTDVSPIYAGSVQIRSRKPPRYDVQLKKHGFMLRSVEE